MTTFRRPLLKRRRLLKWLGGTALGGIGLNTGKNSWLSAGPGWKGPVTDHFDGRRFLNPWLKESSSFGRFLKWKMTRKAEEWPTSAGGMVEPRLLAKLDSHEMTATFIGHATWLLQFCGLNVLTDPVFSDRCSPVTWAGPRRVRPPGIAWEDLPEIHMVVVSHNHYDHLDLPTLLRLRDRFDPLIVTGLGNKAFLKTHDLTHCEELDWWGTISPRDGLQVTFTPAQHWSNRGGDGRNATLWGGFHLKTPGGPCAYFVGDSGYGPCFAEIGQRLPAPDLALVPIGAYEPRWFMSIMHMNPEEAVKVFRDLNAKRMLGMHFGTWQLTDEGIDRPIDALHAARLAANLTEDIIRAPAVGETMRFPA